MSNNYNYGYSNPDTAKEADKKKKPYLRQLKVKGSVGRNIEQKKNVMKKLFGDY